MVITEEGIEGGRAGRQRPSTGEGAGGIWSVCVRVAHEAVPAPPPRGGGGDLGEAVEPAGWGWRGRELSGGGALDGRGQLINYVNSLTILTH